MNTLEKDLADVLETEEARQHALVKNDQGALEWLLADDLVHVHSSGQVHTKPEFMAHLNRMGGFRSIERGPLDIRVEGDIAIVTGSTINGVTKPDTREPVTLEGFATQILRRGPKGWQIVLSQLTPFRAGPQGK
ncbi:MULTISPECIES: nuclear transport factor 2 family protein [unclassified Devosia]|uniref:nuclear transport factor 2 family protein n=1 Tax=unclassified Devosia TaxID=196773 RepID=UPI00145D91C2|nr:MULTISPECIES: nuclear transport factor 2 family protein [unclassified Devosia]MBJ6987885.1 nuclear transport factor 2 family protein [Devosia sp. MC521]MBK1796101.1 nuclear transport factor 2 family protein [Devosia sp. WQ 349K1]QMW63788.1 nuclear transport factor 2 family protein [Devosia sp. MC521]